MSPTVSWFDIFSPTTTTPALLTTTVSVSGLVTGTYTTALVIDGGEVDGSPQTINVSLIVAEEIFGIYLPLVSKDN